MKIGSKIRGARAECGMTQAELATAIGCSSATVANWEKGKTGVKVDSLKKISEVTEKSLEYFLGLRV